MDHDTTGARDEALSFLVNHDTGVLATVSGSGEPRARMVYYTCDDFFNVYFITLTKTRKTGDLASHPRAAFVVAETDIPRTLQLEGVVSDLTETATNDAMLVGFIRRLMDVKPYGIPLSHFDASAMRFYRLAPNWVRWGDFTFGQGTEEVLSEIDPAEPPQ